MDIPGVITEVRSCRALRELGFNLRREHAAGAAIQRVFTSALNSGTGAEISIDDA